MRSRFLYYAITAVIIGLALASQLLLYSVTPVTAPFMFFAFIVLLTTWFMGWPSGILASILSTAVLEYFFIHPVGFHVRAPVDYLTSLIFLAASGCMIFLVTAKRRSDERLIHLNNDLEQRVTERTTELEKATKELAHKQALASIGLAAASLAHDIANPLQTVSLEVQLLDLRLRESQQTVDEKVNHRLANINGHLTVLLNLLTELREVSRPTKLNLTAVDLKHEIREVVRSQEALFAARRIQIVDSLPDNLSPVKGDVDKLKRVVSNLCKNAVDAMPEGGSLTLRAHADRSHVCFEIQDTGGGIVKGENIFDAFATSKAEGWGLGLSIVYQIVSAHNGRIEYHSTPGEGTTFKVCLPA